MVPEMGDVVMAAGGGALLASLPEPNPDCLEPARMNQRAPEVQRRSGWLLLLIPLVATLAAGAWFGRSYFDGHSGDTLATTGAKDSLQPAATVPADPPASPDPQASATAQAQIRKASQDLGTVSGRYVLKGPAKAPAGSVVVFVLAGPKHAVFTDKAAPYAFSFDSARIPNGRYTIGVTVTRPGRPTIVQDRRMEVANTAPAKPKTPIVLPTPLKKPGGSGSTGSGSSGSPGHGLSSQAAQVLQITNAERAKAGCKALAVNSKLTSAAQAHSADMAKNNYFAHNSQDGTSPFDRMKRAGYNFRAAAENIAAGQTTAASVMNAWMNSAGHKANILNCTYTQIGIGYATRGGTPYWTQDFGTPL